MECCMWAWTINVQISAHFGCFGFFVCLCLTLLSVFSSHQWLLDTCLLLSRPHKVEAWYIIIYFFFLYHTASANASCLLLFALQTWWTLSSSWPGLLVSAWAQWTCRSWTTAPTALTWNICQHQTMPPFPPPPSLLPCPPHSYPPSRLLVWPMTSVHRWVRNTWPTWTTQTCTATEQNQTHTVSPVCGSLSKHVSFLFYCLNHLVCATG